MTTLRRSDTGPDPESRAWPEGDPELEQAGGELDVKRALTGLQGLIALSMRMFDEPQVDGVLRVLAASVRSVTGCELVEVRFRYQGSWVSWPSPASALREIEPVTEPLVKLDRSLWRCTAPIAASSGRPGCLVLRSASRPESVQLFVIKQLGHLLGAALMNAELHERDRRRARELDRLNDQLTRTLALLRHHQAVQKTFTNLLKSHQQAKAEIENRLSRDLVNDLLEGAVTPEEAEARAVSRGHDLRVPHDVIVVRWPSPDPKPGTPHDHVVYQIREWMARQGRPCLVARRQAMIVILAHSGVDSSALYNDMCRGLERSDGQIGIGEPALTPQEIPRAYGQARRALAARRQSAKPYGATAYAYLGVTRILAIEENAAEVERLISEWLGKLLDYDEGHGTELVPTLAAYLDHGGNYDKTARALSIHRNTLRYRLARTAEISGHDITDVDTRLSLHLSTRAWMYRRQPPDHR